MRGFGNVLWYPTAAAPVFLGDGAKLFQLVGKTKLQQASATIHLRLTVEYLGDPPDAAFFCGRREQLKSVSENQSLPVAESPGVSTAEFSATATGIPNTKPLYHRPGRYSDRRQPDLRRHGALRYVATLRSGRREGAASALRVAGNRTVERAHYP